MGRIPPEQEIELARQWHRRGLLAPGALQALEQEHAQRAAAAASGQGEVGHSRTTGAPADDGSIGSQVLHGLGGALLGAAGIALVLLLDIPGPDRDVASAWILAALGAVGVAAGLGLLYVLRQRSLADAFMIGGMLCLTVSALPDRDVGRLTGPVAALASIALPLLRRGEMLAAFCMLSFGASLFASIERAFGEPAFIFSEIPDPAVTLWFLVALAHLAAVLIGRLAGMGWLRSALGVVPVTIVAPALMFIFEVVETPGDNPFFDRYGGGEILLALLEGALVAVALWRRLSHLLIGAAAVICVDAVVFAFDVGGLEFGVVSLVLVATAILWLATFMRRRWAKPAPVRPAV